MTILWIIHRDGAKRAALARLAGAGGQQVLGEPTDSVFQTAPAAAVVLLGLAGDFEQELEFVHRFSPRLRGSRWILIPETDHQQEAERLFDSLDCEVVCFPPGPEQLRNSIRAILAVRGVEALSERATRDALTARFARWFADLEMPELLRAIDPQMASDPLLVCGEAGTGRELLARYIHSFGGGRGGRFLHLVCRGVSSARALLDQIEDDRPPSGVRAWTIWLENVDELDLAVQSRVRGWIELGVPEELRGASRIRWIASSGDRRGAAGSGIDPGLAQLLSRQVIRIPPLRERSGAIAPLVSDCALHWCSAHRERTRRFSEEALQELRDYPWPGNLRELEGVIERSLVASGADPLTEDDLRFEAEVLYELETPVARDTASAAVAVAGELPVSGNLSNAPVTGETSAGEVIDDSPRTDAATSPSHPGDREVWQRLIGAVAHEIRNPLVSIRTLAELLPERFEDEEFRTRFSELVGSDIRRIEQVVNQLQDMTGANSAGAGRQPVDVAGLLDALLDERQDQIQSRHVLVLKELDRAQPFAMGDPQRLHGAFRGMIHRALALVPERGDVYVASKHHPSGLRGEPSVRILLRFQTGSPPPRSEIVDGVEIEGVSESEVALEFVAADAAIRDQGGTFSMDTTDSQETVIVIDLQAPD